MNRSITFNIIKSLISKHTRLQSTWFVMLSSQLIPKLGICLISLYILSSSSSLELLLSDSSSDDDWDELELSASCTISGATGSTIYSSSSSDDVNPSCSASYCSPICRILARISLLYYAVSLSSLSAILNAPSVSSLSKFIMLSSWISSSHKLS